MNDKSKYKSLIIFYLYFQAQKSPKEISRFDMPPCEIT